MGARKSWRVAVVGVAGAAFLAASLGRVDLVAAQPAPLSKAQKAEVAERYNRGTSLYKLGRWEESIDEYQKAYLISNDPVMLYNMAQANRMWGRHEEALRLYKVYLRDTPGAPNRADVEAKIADLQKQIVEQKAAPPVETPPPVVTPPPVAPPPVAPAPAPVVETRPALPPPSGTRKIVGWTLVGVAGAFVTTSLVLGQMAKQKAREVEDDAKNGDRFNPDTEKSGKALSNGAAFTALLGIAAGGTGAYLLLTRGAQPQVASAPSRPRAVVHPWLAPGLAGAGAHFTF